MNLIAAVDLNWAIGRGGDQLCYIPADLKRFQALTTGHPVILGRKTLATFPGGRPLKNRRNLILSRDPSFAPEGAEVFRSLEALRAAARRASSDRNTSAPSGAKEGSRDRIRFRRFFRGRPPGKVARVLRPRITGWPVVRA